MKGHIITLNLVLFLFFTLNAQRHNIIPAPVSFVQTDAVFLLDGPLMLNASPEIKETVGLMRQKLAANGLYISDDQKAKKSLNIEMVKKEALGSEGYQLKVDNKSITIIASESGGVFNGLQTLLQITSGSNVGGNIQGCEITDYPRFKWRGLMLDVSRHFFTVDEVKQYIDKMSEYKFNTFHWHLTDDEGWRVEIKSLPKLTEVGAWRVERAGKFGEDRAFPLPGEKPTYGGFYTQEQIKDVVAYAAARNITIVPEVDVPGHSMAALAAYPELSTKKEPKFVNPGSKFAEWYGNGKFEMLIENTLNPADEKVYEFMDKVMGELAMLFPGKYIHMGGDECYKGFWEKSKDVQAFMKKNNIKDAHELQSYFVKRVEKIVSSKGKTLIGWDEILEGGLADGAAVMSWRGLKGGIEAAKMGHDVVMSPTTYAYIDYTQGDPSVENPIYASLSLEKTYEFEPVPDGIDAKYILGGQANLWSEMVPSLPFAFYMTYPRAMAISEAVWSQKKDRDWNSFVRRVMFHFDEFDEDNIAISKAVYEPIITVYKEDLNLMVKLENNIPDSEIRYTIDNTYPVSFGNTYSAPFKVPEGLLSLRTQTFLNGKSIGRSLIIPRSELVKRVVAKK
ncbi:MAG: family 20 glycosylhydrolase [Saprospiraceae bacterium]